MKLLLTDIRSEASRLRERGGQVTNSVDDTYDEKVLEILQRRYERGELSESEYAAKKRQVLEQILE